MLFSFGKKNIRIDELSKADSKVIIILPDVRELETKGIYVS